MSEGGGTRILVVDDNEPARYATARVLRAAKFEVIEAGDGRAALAKIETDRPELVVLDVNLPDMSGYDVCRRIRVVPSTASTLVLHLSATYVDSTSKVVGLEGGADAYLTQPVSPAELVATIKALLRIRRAEEEARRQAEEASVARTELEHVLAALREKNHTLEALFQASPLPIIALSADAHVTAWNSAAERVFGWKEHEVIGRPLPTISQEERRKAALQPEEMACRGEVLAHRETVRERKDGTCIPVNLSAAPLLDSEGRLQGSIIVASDETQRKMAEDALRRHERLVAAGRMASALAHEINNPLSAVVNRLYLLNQHGDIHPEVRDALQLIDGELSRVTEITKHMLALHRTSPERVAFKVAEMLEAALSLYTVQLRERQIEVLRDYDAATTVVLPPGEIRQVFSNLIANAIEVLEPGGILKLRVRKLRNAAGTPGVRISIADNGPGIPAEIQTRIYEPFFTTKGEKGTGLGLWVVRGILDKYRASIRMRSSTVSGRKGTTFCFFLPETWKQTAIATEPA